MKLQHQRTATLVAVATICLLLSGWTIAGDDQSGKASLYDRLGGLGPISVVVDDFIDAMLPDEFLNQNPAIDKARERVPGPYLKYHVTAMVCQVTGGPCEYHGRGMKEAHTHLNISEAEWDRMVEIFLGVLNEHNVPEREQQELLQIIGSTKGDIVMAEPNHRGPAGNSTMK